MNSESLISKLRITNICISYITDPLIKANFFFFTLILDANYCDIFNLQIIAIRVIFCQRSIQKIKMCLHNCLTSAVSCQCLCFCFFFPLEALGELWRLICVVFVLCLMWPLWSMECCHVCMLLLFPRDTPLFIIQPQHHYKSSVKCLINTRLIKARTDV